MGEFDEHRLHQRERERIQNKIKDMFEWLSTIGQKASKEQSEVKLKEMETAWNVIMIRVSQAMDDFWDKQLAETTGEKAIHVKEGGFFLSNGYDLRELMDEAD